LIFSLLTVQVPLPGHSFDSLDGPVSCLSGRSIQGIMAQFSWLLLNYVSKGDLEQARLHPDLKL